MPDVAAPSIADLAASGEDREDQESKWSRWFQWSCPGCSQLFVGRSQPIPQSVASYLESMQQFLAKHVKEHVDHA